MIELFNNEVTMEFIQAPKVFHLAGTGIDTTGLDAYLKHIGVEDWETDVMSDAEILIEVCGKTCYKAFSADLNANLTKVRESDNKRYIGNILNQKHGSVLEHVYDTYVLVGVSRVLTHEMVRHRLANYSQESLRFVRLTDLEAYFPDCFKQQFLNGLNISPEQVDEGWLRGKMENVFEYLEDVQLELANKLNLDNLKNFDKKKKLTSAMRRLAPIGLATTIIMTTNPRNWRHIITQRTNRHAEEEIRRVTTDIFQDLYERYPNIYQDYLIEEVDGITEITFINEKV